jgi:hypothetical protein
MAWRPLKLTLYKTKFVDDMAVTGTAVWHEGRDAPTRCSVWKGPTGLSGTLHLSFTTLGNRAARIRGEIGGQRVSVSAPVPFQP